MPLELQAGPVEEPVTLAELKNSLRVDETADDLLLNSLITAARLSIETSSGTIMINQSWSFYRNAIRGKGAVHLPLSPLQTVDEIRLHHSDGTTSTLSEDEYSVDPAKTAPKVQFRNTTTSKVCNQELNSIEIRFTAGFGASATVVPDDLKQAVLMLASHWYEQRGHGGLGVINDIPASVNAIIRAHKSIRLQ